MPDRIGTAVPITKTWRVIHLYVQKLHGHNVYIVLAANRMQDAQCSLWHNFELRRPLHTSTLRTRSCCIQMLDIALFYMTLSQGVGFQFPYFKWTYMHAAVAIEVTHYFVSVRAGEIYIDYLTNTEVSSISRVPGSLAYRVVLATSSATPRQGINPPLLQLEGDEPSEDGSCRMGIKKTRRLN